jgi:hypothetical protein
MGIIAGFIGLSFLFIASQHEQQQEYDYRKYQPDPTISAVVSPSLIMNFPLMYCILLMEMPDKRK